MRAKNLFKKLILCVMCICTLSFANFVSASAEEGKEVSIEYLENGDYIETYILDTATEENNAIPVVLSQEKTITKTKVKTYKNSAGKVMWSLSVDGTFSYNGKTSKCTKALHHTQVVSKNWTVQNPQSYKSGNTATAKARFSRTDAGVQMNATVTLQCSATGKIS